MSQPKRIDIKEFRAAGYLQEVNRQFFHPLGLALEVAVDKDTGEERLGGVWDHRDDPEGMIYANSIVEGHDFAVRAIGIKNEQTKRHTTRKQNLGYDIQPVFPVKEESKDA